MPKLSRKISNPAISVNQLTVAFGENTVLNNVTLDIPRGDIVSIIGPNGSGKTTLIKTILGLIKPKKGEVEIFGETLRDVRHKIGYVPQKFAFDGNFPLTVSEFFSLPPVSQPSAKRLRTVMKDVGLKKFILSKELGSLSGGQLQRVLIAQAILHDPDLLILDEPSTGIDVVGEAAFYEILTHLNSEHNTTILLISHDVSMVSQRVHRVICLNKRLLCFGTPKQTLTKKNLEKLYNDARVFEHTHKK